jgi:Tfp pilus assembly protein PilX
MLTLSQSNNKRNERGFVLVISLMLLLVTTTMGTMLLVSASGQSKMARASGDKQQTFLAADTGIQEAIAYLSGEAEAGNDPVNNATTASICDIPISSLGINSYTAILSGANLSYAFRSGNSNTDYTSLSTAMALTGDAAGYYQNDGYIYYLSKLDTAVSSGSNAGGSIGDTGCYSAQCSSVSSRYVVLSCGINTDESPTATKRSVLMSIMSMDS